jgi:Uma2 family endonuclease
MRLRVPERPITVDFYRQMPEGPPYYELIEGNLIMNPEPGPDDRLQVPEHPITTDLYFKMPEGPPYYELINGHLVMSPSPSFFHQKISGRLFQYIINYLDAHPIGHVLYAPSDVILNKINVYQPDIYFISNARRQLISKRGVEGAPDLVVEILSPSNAARDRREKRETYAGAGVQELWLIEPSKQVLEVHPLSFGLNAPVTIVREAEIFRPAMFPGLQIDLAKLFQPIS